MASNWRLSARDIATIAKALQNIDKTKMYDTFGFASISSEEIDNLTERFVVAAKLTQGKIIAANQHCDKRCGDCG